MPSLPDRLDPGVLYLAADGDIAAHLCACGCGKEVVTPLSPTDWSLELERRGATLLPSIGNWSFPCRSHYFIRDGGVIWAGSMSDQAINVGRQRDHDRKQRYYERPEAPKAVDVMAQPARARQSLLNKFSTWVKRLFQ